MSIGWHRRGRLAYRAFLWAMATLGLLAFREAAMAATSVQSDNLVQNGSFEVAGTRNVPSGWTVAGAVGDVKTDAINPSEGSVSLKLSAQTGRGVRLSQVVPVQPRTTLLFTAAVNSPDRVVATVGKVRMAYHRQGQWQTLVGLIETGNATKLTVNFDLRGLSDKAPTMKLDAVTLRPMRLPESLHRKTDASRTLLVDQGKPAATIIYPATVPQYKALAQRVQAAIAQRSGGVLLPMVSDIEATEPGPPLLKPAMAKQNLILIGRLGINRAMWPAYNRFQMAADGYYPGGDGYVVRTAANVMRNGKNQIILGSSSEAGATAAVDAFIQTALPQATADGQTLALPWLLKTKIEGACLAALKQHDALWKADPHSPSLPPVEPGYGTVRRWYQNAMGYYWTGWDSYKARALELLQPILADRAYTHHYIAQFFVRTWDMLDDSPLYSPQQRAAVDQLLLTNFLRFCTDAGDLTWMTTFSPPYDQINVLNRHQIEPWMADLAMADFFHDYFDLSGDVDKLVAFRRSEKDTFLRSMAAHRWDESLPGIGMSESRHQIAQSLFRYALERGDYTLFESGHARLLPAIPFIHPLSGNWVRPAGPVNTKVMFGILASYYHDGRYLTLMHQLPSDAPFMERILCGIHAYTPGAELQPQNADAFTGLSLPPMMPQRLGDVPALQARQFQPIQFPADQAFDFASFRSGFDREDDYIALNGLALPSDIPGTFLSFVSRGMDWFGFDSQFGPAGERYFDQNGVFVIRTDQLSGKNKPYPAAARLDWSADLHRAGDVCFTLDPFVGMRWQRDVVWIRPGLCVVRDRLTAKQAGHFQVGVNWRPAGSPAWDGTTWTSTARAGQFRLMPLGQGFHVEQNVKAFLAGEESTLYLRQVASPNLKANQSIEAFALLQALHPGSEPAIAARQAGENALYLSAEGSSAERILIAWDQPSGNGIASDARLVVLRPNIVQLVGGTHLEIDGKPVLKSERPINVLADFTAGIVCVDNPHTSGKQVLRLIGADGALGTALAVEPGKSQVEISHASVPMPLAPPQVTPGAVADAGATQAWPVRDQTAQWHSVWHYAALRQPMLVRGRHTIGDDVVDLGRVVNLAEIDLAPPSRGRQVPEPLPQEIWVSAGDAQGNAPPAGSPLWHKIQAKPQWAAGAFTGNYGYIKPSQQYMQVLPLENIKARYIRAKGADRLVFFDADRTGAPLPLEIHLTGEADRILIAPHVWPKFVGMLPYWRDQVAMLDGSGREVYRYTSPTRIENVQLLPLEGDGPRSVVISSIDGRIRQLKPDGSVGRDMDLFAMHGQFNQDFGRPNTRQPAGGFARPFAVGLWHPSGSALPSWVVARYHSFSFLNPDGSFEGVLSQGSYVQPTILPEGIDFDGDGRQEQVCLGRGVLLKLSGPQDKRVEQPTGHLFYPQVYHATRLSEPAWEPNINGAAVRLFQPVQLAPSAPGRLRHLVSVRENYAALYDGMKNKWAWSWAPLVSIRAAAVVQDTPRALRLLVATDDGLLWTLNFDKAPDRPASFDAKPFPGRISRLTPDPADTGGALIAADTGLYRMDAQGALSRCADGAFADVRRMPGAQSILAVQRDGQVLRLDPAGKP